jgi:hypothetical protein
MTLGNIQANCIRGRNHHRYDLNAWGDPVRASATADIQGCRWSGKARGKKNKTSENGNITANGYRFVEGHLQKRSGAPYPSISGPNRSDGERALR